MKLMFASDIHGSYYCCNKLKDLYEKEEAEKLILLGDLLYHGPRNDLPREYDPKGVISILNEMKQEILCVRGNCDAQVDQMVLEFPILSEYMTMFIKGRMFFVTHGHVYNEQNLPMIKKGDILIHGHTHVQAMEDREEYIYINPGSVSIPKEGNKSSYIIYEDGTFTLKDIKGNVINTFIL